MKTRTLTGRALDYAVALADDLIDHAGEATFDADLLHDSKSVVELLVRYSPSTGAAGDDIIDREGITVIRCDDDYGTDAQGFTTNKRIPVWAATLGHHSAGDIYGSQGDSWGTVYALDVSDMTYGATRREAAMRCYVASKLGEEVEIPEELN